LDVGEHGDVWYCVDVQGVHVVHVPGADSYMVLGVGTEKQLSQPMSLVPSWNRIHVGTSPSGHWAPQAASGMSAVQCAGHVQELWDAKIDSHVWGVALEATGMSVPHGEQAVDPADPLTNLPTQFRQVADDVAAGVAEALPAAQSVQMIFPVPWENLPAVHEGHTAVLLPSPEAVPAAQGVQDVCLN
jgi:hypothetical protein